VGRTLNFRHHECGEADADETDHDELLPLTPGQLRMLRRHGRRRFNFLPSGRILL
jgi:hypothetical protein